MPLYAHYTYILLYYIYIYISYIILHYPHSAQKKRWTRWSSQDAPQDAHSLGQVPASRLHSRSGSSSTAPQSTNKNLAGTNCIQLHYVMILPYFIYFHNFSYIFYLQIIHRNVHGQTQALRSLAWQCMA